MHIFFKSSLWCKRKKHIFFYINCNSYIFISIIKKNHTVRLKPSNWDKDDLYNYNYYTYIKKYYWQCKNCERQCKNMKCHPLICKYTQVFLNKIWKLLTEVFHKTKIAFAASDELFLHCYIYTHLISLHLHFVSETVT